MEKKAYWWLGSRMIAGLLSFSPQGRYLLDWDRESCVRDTSEVEPASVYQERRGTVRIWAFGIIYNQTSFCLSRLQLLTIARPDVACRSFTLSSPSQRGSSMRRTVRSKMRRRQRNLIVSCSHQGHSQTRSAKIIDARRPRLAANFFTLIFCSQRCG